MLHEEAIDRFVRRPFDLSVQVLLVPVVWRQRIEIVVVAREAVPDVGPRAESSSIVEGEVAGPTDSAAAYDSCMGCGLFGNPLLEFSVGWGKGEEAHDGDFQLVSIAILLAPAGLSSEGTLGRTACGRFFGARQCGRNGLAGRPKSEKPTMLALLASRLPRDPVGTRSLDGPGQEGITRGQEVPADRDPDVSMLGIPRTVLGRVNIQMLYRERFIVRRLRIVHTYRLGGCDPLCKWTRPEHGSLRESSWDRAPNAGVLRYGVRSNNYLPTAVAYEGAGQLGESWRP
jgi:hypothetical protein